MTSTPARVSFKRAQTRNPFMEPMSMSKGQDLRRRSSLLTGPFITGFLGSFMGRYAY